MKHDKILEMLKYRRPAGSEGEKEFLERFIRPHNPALMALNLVVIVPGGSGKTLFSCHTDTVHRNDEKQNLVVDLDMEQVFKDDDQPLGGDNTAGVWMLLEMIELKIPGTYVFHYGEERGCVGSKAMAREFPNWLKNFDRAIAFDRRGVTSIITHQGGNRCCSDEFGLAIADGLKNGFELDTTGLWTDTASYTALIPECTNISIGYYDEHGPKESLDLAHLELMKLRVQEVKWDELPTKREPGVRSARDTGRVWPQTYHQPYVHRPPVLLPAQPRRRPTRLIEMEDYDDETIDFLIQDAIGECNTFGRTIDLCANDSEYAATFLRAFIVRELRDLETYGDPEDFTPEPSVAEVVETDPEVQEMIGEIAKRNFMHEETVH